MRDDTGEKAGGRLDWYSRRRPPRSSHGLEGETGTEMHSNTSRREGKVQKRDVASLVYCCSAHTCRRQFQSGPGNRPRPDVDVWSHPQKLDMSGGSGFSTKDRSGSEAVCLFILRNISTVCSSFTLCPPEVLQCLCDCLRSTCRHLLFFHSLN